MFLIPVGDVARGVLKGSGYRRGQRPLKEALLYQRIARGLEMQCKTLLQGVPDNNNSNHINAPLLKKPRFLVRESLIGLQFAQFIPHQMVSSQLS